MSVFKSVRKALELSTDSITGFPGSDRRDWENVNFDPEIVSETWVRLNVIPVSDRPSTRGGTPQMRLDGLFLISIFTPTNQGPDAADELADEICSTYTVGSLVSADGVNVRFEYAERGQGSEPAESPWYMVQVTARWFTYYQKI